MKPNLLFLLIFGFIGPYAQGQNPFPRLNTDALVQQQFDLNQLNKPYTLVIYGGVGCGFSKYLIENLGVLSGCKDKCDIILIMDQAKDSINKHMAGVLEQYPIFTNTLLQYQLKKKADIFPQLLLFRNQVQVEHIVGIKEGMLRKTKELIMTGK